MRKRSEAMAEPAQQAAQQPAKKDEFFDDDKPRPPPEPSAEPTDARASVEEPRFWQENKIKFVRCDCGLKQSLITAKAKDPALLECIKCRKPLGSLEDAELVLAGGAPKGQPNPGLKQTPLGEKCETCGADITITAVGKFWPCGHSPRTMEAAAKVDPEAFEKKAVASTANAFLDAPTKDAERAVAIYKNPITGREPITHAPKLGTTTVTLGKMVFTPIPYNTFEVGPFTATVGDDETPEQVMAALKVISANAHEEALKQYIERVGKNDRTVTEFAASRKTR